MYYKLQITETGRNSLREEPSVFDRTEEKFKTLEEVIKHLEWRYGKIPKRRVGNTIYREPDDTPIGFLKSFWNKDWSHNSKGWYQTDWVEVTRVVETPVLVN